jgi:hypothetical protein
VDFSISEDLRAWATEKMPQVNLDKEVEVFKDYWLGNGKKMCRWDAVFRNWIRRAPRMGGSLYNADEIELRALMREYQPQGFRPPFQYETPRAYRAAFDAKRTHELPQRDLKCIADLSTAKRMRK